MPNYEYRCENCTIEFEYEQSIKEEPKNVCENCLKPALKRLISQGTNFSLKGGGWYKDLYSKTSGGQS